MQTTINQKSFEVPEDASILDAIRSADICLIEPELGLTKEWIRNPSCPLLGLAEVNGQLVPLSMLKARIVREGMTIETQSAQIRETTAQRAQLLKDRHECHFIREWQMITAVEGENAGFVTMEQWEQFRFAERRNGPSIVHDPNKCIRCKACVDVCENIQGVKALSFDEKLGVQIDEKRCVQCGQCIHHCPMGATAKSEIVNNFFNCQGCPYARPVGAMHEMDDTARAWSLLKDPQKYCVVQFAPAVRASLGEEFDIPAGALVTGKLYAALRRLGFKKVWDTNFAADLTIMEEGSEFIERFSTDGCLPMFTSCSPGWIRFVELYFPDLISHLSTAKSPQQMFGAVAKSFGVKTLNISSDSMSVISIMPCTAKKAEAARPEMNSAYKYWMNDQHTELPSYPDIDLVLTTRELSRLLKMAGIDIQKMPDEQADSMLGEYTGAAPIFGRTGGVMEAALRTASAILTGDPPSSLDFEELESFAGIKRAELPVGGQILKVAVAHGLENARKVCESIRSGGDFAGYHFIEFMTCPGGCIGGGGQPIPTNPATKQSRMLALNRDDREVCRLRMSHENMEVKALYDSFLEKPLSHLAHELLHTSYTARPLA